MDEEVTWPENAGARETPVGVLHPVEQGAPPPIVNAHTMECIPTLTQPPYVTQAAYITGKVGTHNTVILLDSGASCSVLSKTHIPLEHIQPEHKIRLLNADGRTLLPAGVAQVNVVLGDFQTTQTFVIADNLSTPVILGCDFLNRHGFTINFKNCTVTTPDHQGLQLNLQMKNYIKAMQYNNY